MSISSLPALTPRSAALPADSVGQVLPGLAAPLSRSGAQERPGTARLPGARSPLGDARVAAGLRDAARQFEAVFLAEMLRHAGFGRMPEGFNGGAGEAGFSGTLIREHASRIAEAGGLGIADRIVAAKAAEASSGPAAPAGTGG